MATYEEMSRTGQLLTDILGLCFALFYFAVWATMLGGMVGMVVWAWYQAAMWVLMLF